MRERIGRSRSTLSDEAGGLTSWSAGSGTDLMSRTLAQKLGEAARAVPQTTREEIDVRGTTYSISQRTRAGAQRLRLASGDRAYGA